MKAWIVYGSFLVLLALAAWLVPVISENPGHVEIIVAGWVLETSAVALVLAFVALFASLWFIFWLLAAPRRLAARLARRGLEDGLLALAEGDWKKAEKTLLRSARHLNSPAGYLAAARSAQGEDAAERRDAYLEAADDGGRRTRLLIGLTKARVLMTEERWLEAAQLLLELRAQYGKRHTQVLRMLLFCYRTLGDWRAALGILPDLRKRQVVDDDQAAQIIALALNQAAEQGHSHLPALWQSVPRNLQQIPAVVAAYAQASRQAKHPEWALPLVSKALKREWSGLLVEAYGAVATQDAKKALAQCEAWRRQHPQDAMLERLMGRLCQLQGLWGKAREHYERSIKLEPRAESYRMLGDFLTERGENDAALVCYRNALRLEQGNPTQPLPVSVPRPMALPAISDSLDAPKDYA